MQENNTSIQFRLVFQRGFCQIFLFDLWQLIFDLVLVLYDLSKFHQKIEFIEVLGIRGSCI